MKKYGKFEKRPPAKQVLLNTYLTSLLSLTLCVAMFFGTSFAWFTSEVNNTQNEIYIGTLDVDMFKQDGDKWQDLASSDANTTKLFDGNIRWEPGYTTVETIKLVNKGDLAFNYVLNFIESPKDATATQAESETTTETETADELDVMEVAKFFDVWVYKHTEKNTFTNPASYDDITAAGSGWTHAGSLNELLAGKAVLTGSMDDVRENKTATVPTESTGASTETTAAPSETSKNEFDGKESDVTYTIALHMRTDATGTYKDSEGKEHSIMGYKITLNVKLIAYQMAAEKDEFGTIYDKLTEVRNAEELAKAIAKGGNIILLNDIDLGEKQVTIPADVTVMLELNGYTISQTKKQTTAYAMIDNKGTLTISDSVGTGKISYIDSGAGGEYASNTISNEGVLNITGGTVENLSSDNVAKTGYPHAIDVYQGSVTNIYGGTVKSANYDCIRMFCNSETLATTVNIYGGNIINRVTFQNPGSNMNAIGVLNITGGTFTTTNNVTANVRLLNFSTKCEQMKATISGGTFDKGIKTQNNVSGITIDWLDVADGVTVNIVP